MRRTPTNPARNSIDMRQLLAVGIVVLILAFFLANTTILAIGGGVNATPPRTVKMICYDTDNGLFAGIPGATIVIELEKPLTTRATNAQLAANVTSMTTLGEGVYQILLQPPGITGNAAKGTMWILRDIGYTAEQFDTDAVSSESGSSDRVVVAPSATLTEYGCYSSEYSTQKRFTGKKYATGDVDYLLNLAHGPVQYDSFIDADYLTN